VLRRLLEPPYVERPRQVSCLQFYKDRFGVVADRGRSFICLATDVVISHHHSYCCFCSDTSCCHLYCHNYSNDCHLHCCCYCFHVLSKLTAGADNWLCGSHHTLLLSRCWYLCYLPSGRQVRHSSLSDAVPKQVCICAIERSLSQQDYFAAQLFDAHPLLWHSLNQNQQARNRQLYSKATAIMEFVGWWEGFSHGPRIGPKMAYLHLWNSATAVQMTQFVWMELHQSRNSSG